MQEQWFMLLSHHQIEKKLVVWTEIEHYQDIAASILVFALNISLTETQLNSWDGESLLLGMLVDYIWCRKLE